MTVFESNEHKILKVFNWSMLGHIPVFMAMAWYFETQMSIAVIGPLLLLAGQLLWGKVFQKNNVAAVLLGFSALALSGIMIHLGKGMIEWHFHIFVMIGILSLLANPWTIIAAATTGAIHHLAFWYFIPESIFNYEASFGIVVIHALFVVFETIACVYLSLNFKKSLVLQQKLAQEVAPLIKEIDEVSASSKASCTKLLDNANDNSASIAEISSSSEEITQMVNSTQKQINRSFEVMESTEISVEKSSQAITGADAFFQRLSGIVSSMENLQQESETKLKTVEEAVNDISNKTSVINDIVFQTKLLSFNASVEAARAGEHGKGFAVVAEEISILANNSGTASDEIGKIVTNSKQTLGNSIDHIVESISAFKDDIQQAFGTWSEINEELKTSFGEVMSNTKTQKDYLREILEATSNQSEGINELSEALARINTSSHESLGQLEEVEKMIKRLENESNKLAGLQAELGFINTQNDEDDEQPNLKLVA